MANKAYQPKVDAGDDLVIEGFVPRQETADEEGNISFDRRDGETFVIGDDEHPWPFATENPHLQDFLDAHPLVKSVALKKAANNTSTTPPTTATPAPTTPGSSTSNDLGGER